MALKLFHSTGYSSLLTAGETRSAMHPGWVILATSIWVGFACNAALWRQLRVPGASSLPQALVSGTFVAAACAIVLSVLGWRKTLKPAATLLLFLAALAVCTVQGEPAPAAAMADLPPFGLALPAWTGLLHWQTWATLAGLALLPAACIFGTQLRRLPGDKQFGANMRCLLAAAAVLALSGLLLFGHLF